MNEHQQQSNKCLIDIPESLNQCDSASHMHYTRSLKKHIKFSSLLYREEFETKKNTTTKIIFKTTFITKNGK